MVLNALKGISAKRSDMNTIGARRRIASLNKEAIKLQSAEGEHIINIRRYATDLRNSAAFDPNLAPADALLVPLDELGERQCKWPLYRDGETQLYCGCKTRHEKSYCATHHAVAYRPIKELNL